MCLCLDCYSKIIVDCMHSKLCNSSNATHLTAHIVILSVYSLRECTFTGQIILVSSKTCESEGFFESTREVLKTCSRSSKMTKFPITTC